MIITPHIGKEVQVWYRKEWASWMPYHGRIGIVKVCSRGKPRNHGIEIAGVMVVVPCGNIRPIPPARADDTGFSTQKRGITG